MVNTHDLLEMLAASHEWLLVRDHDRTFPLIASEIQFSDVNGERYFGFIDDRGFHNWRLNSAAIDGSGIVLDVAGARAKTRETMQLVPREPASSLMAGLEAARMSKANGIAGLIVENFPGTRLGRVAINADNGRLAQVEFETADKVPLAALADITAKLAPEVVFTMAIKWLEKLALRKKKPVNKIWLICEKRQARSAQKLQTLLTTFWQARITVFEINRKADPPCLIESPARRMRDLWREKPPKLSLPKSVKTSNTAQKIIDLSPKNIDVVFSRQGETLRFNGLPFARVRTIAGEERAWIGTTRTRQMLTRRNWGNLAELIINLNSNRSHAPRHKRHELYRAAPEAWLESILRRNINLLDANLVLSPIYNQFRFVRDKIDLLALRRDGRLVIIELKTQPDREAVFQAADYWRKIELQRRRGVLAAANLFDGREIADKPTLLYLAAPAWSFHREFEFFARCLSRDIELWRFELHEGWRREVRVLARQNYEGLTNL